MANQTNIGLAGSALCAVALMATGCGKIPISSPIYSNVPEIAVMDDIEVPASEVHDLLFKEDSFPSARTCQECHPDHFREWSVSPHAYAQLSPVFNAMQGAIVHLTNGSFGDFCIRCHNPVGMNLNEPIVTSNLFRHPASREGVTCITCHRPKGEFGKVSGRFDVNRGTLFDPVKGPSGNEELMAALAANEGSVATEEGQVGQQIHSDVEPFFYLSEPGFCGSCHDVTLVNGFRLEEAFSEYKHSPAAADGVTCQDCHMGKVQGINSGYDVAPAAIVDGKPTKPRKRTNHMFPGPDYSIIHPGIFPHQAGTDLDQWNLTDWLAFDVEAGWGTDEFEKELRKTPKEERPEFPEAWKSKRLRTKGRKIIDKQLELLEEYRVAQLEVLRNGYQFGESEVLESDEDGIHFRIQFKNATDGHNVPTGFIAERSVFLEVTVTDSEGTVVMQSGDTDPNGDIRDSHSVYVHNGELPLDEQLFSLQSKFITRNIRGGEREQVLAVNHSIDPLPFLRPPTFSTIATGEPRGARTHRQSIEPNSFRWADYRVAKDELTGKPPYKAKIRMISGMVPPNLVHEISIVGFDYGMTPREVADAVVAGRSVLWERELDL